MVTRTCNHDGCDEPHRAKGLCQLHYRRNKGCDVEGCTKVYKASGMCWGHYQAARRLPYGLHGLEHNDQCKHVGCNATPMGGGVWCYWHWRQKIDDRGVHGIVRCGTSRGRDRHYNRGEPMCVECDYSTKDWLEIMSGPPR